MEPVLVKSKTKVREIVLVRDAFMLIAYELDYQQKQIGEYLDLATGHICKRIEVCNFACANNSQYNSKIKSIIHRHVPHKSKVQLQIRPEIAEWIKQNVNESIDEGFEQIFESWKSMMFHSESIDILKQA